MEFRLLPGEAKFNAHCKKTDTNTVLGYLNHPKYVFRRTAAIVLLLRGGEYILEQGIKFCSNNDFKLRQMGALIIGEIALHDSDKFNDVISILENLALTDSSSRVRAEAIRSFGLRCEKNQKLYPIILPILKKNINSSHISVRFSITVALHHVKDKEAIPLLEKLLRDPDVDIRNWTAFAINMTELDSKKIRSGLAKMLKEPYYDARCEAITALAVRHDKRVIPALKKELTEKEVRDSMIQAAGSLGDPQFIPILENLLDKFDDFDGLIQASIDRLKSLSETSPSKHATT